MTLTKEREKLVILEIRGGILRETVELPRVGNGAVKYP